MKELYVEPKAEIVHFVAEENIAFDGKTSFLGWDITDNADGNWGNWGKWFGD